MARPVQIVLVVPGSMVVVSILEMSMPAAPVVLQTGRVACACSFLNFALELKQTSVCWRRGEDILVVKRLWWVS